MALSQKLPDTQNYRDYLKDERKVFKDGSNSQPVDLLKYIIEPECLIISGGDKNTKVRFFDILSSLGKIFRSETRTMWVHFHVNRKQARSLENSH